MEALAARLTALDVFQTIHYAILNAQNRNKRRTRGSTKSVSARSRLGMEHTFKNLPEWNMLAVHCRSCDHVAPVNRWEFARKVGKQTVITSLLPKLRCQRCAIKGDCEWRMGGCRDSV